MFFSGPLWSEYRIGLLVHPPELPRYSSVPYSRPLSINFWPGRLSMVGKHVVLVRRRQQRRLLIGVPLWFEVGEESGRENPELSLAKFKLPHFFATTRQTQPNMHENSYPVNALPHWLGFCNAKQQTIWYEYLSPPQNDVDALRRSSWKIVY